MRAVRAKQLRRLAGQIVRERGIKSEAKWMERAIRWMKNSADRAKAEEHVATTQFYSVRYTGYVRIYRGLKRQWKERRRHQL